MNSFFVDVNEKISYEKHIFIFIYIRMNNSNVKYEDVIFYEELLEDYNKFLEDDRNRSTFIDYLNSNKKVIDSILFKFKQSPWNYVKPVIWKDRDRSQYYITNLTLSHRFEVYIESLFASRGIELGLYYGKDDQYNQGETKLGIEIKRDIKSKETGNLYIEYAERLNSYGEWVDSGIFKEDNTRYFLIGDIDKFWILDKLDLIDLYHEISQSEFNRLENGCRFVKAGRGTSLGYIIPKDVVNQICIEFEDLVRKLT